MKQKKSFIQIPPPFELKKIQEWFGALINRPLVENDLINPLTPSGLVISKEAARYIAPSSTLRPHQRLQIYNQQYWWRLQGVLQTNFPLLLRLFGTHSFNESIAVPYLTAYLPNHWALHLLGEKLPTWIQEKYQASDKQLVYDAAYLDWILSASFTHGQYPRLDNQFLTQEDPEELIKKPLCLQPHIFLIQFDHNLPAFRDLIIKESADFWTTHDFPHLLRDKTYYFVIFRNLHNNVAWKDVTLEEYLILGQFSKGSSIEAVCAWMEELEEDRYTLMATHLQKWMQEWTRYGWLTFLPSP